MCVFAFPRQTLTLVGTEAGPFEAAGKDVAGVVKSFDAKLAAVGIVAEKVKSQCKGCPSVSRCFTLTHRVTAQKLTTDLHTEQIVFEKPPSPFFK